jgi:hypothetical protein
MKQELVNLGLYTFSALIQADAAIFALFAVFVIYKLQSLDSQVRTAIDICDTHGKLVIAAVRQLLQVTTDADRHGILMGFRASPYVSQMRIVAFLPSWKEGLPRRAIPLIVVLVLHVSVSCLFLFQATNDQSVLCLPPIGRIGLALTTFVSLVAYISIIGYQMTKSKGLDIVPKVPALPLDDPKTDPAVVLLPPINGVTRMLHYVWKNVDFHVFVRQTGDKKYKFWIAPSDTELFENVQVQEREFTTSDAPELWRIIKENRDTMFSVKPRS